MKYLLGIDCGSTMCKAALYDAEGTEIAVAGSKLDVLSPQPGWREVDPEGLWKAAADAITKVITVSGVAGEDIIGVGASGAGNGVYALDDHKRPVRPGIQSSDARAGAVIQEWSERGVPDACYPICYQGKFPGEMSACLAWIKANEPQVYERISHVIMAKDFVTLCLTGEVVSDISDMSGTSVMDLQTSAYSRELLDLYGIPEMWDALPAMHASHEVVGAVQPAVAELTGLVPGTPVVAGLHDMSACNFGSGAVETGDVAVLVGTLALNTMVTTELPTTRDFWSIRYALPDRYLISTGGGASALNLEWFVTQCCGGEAAEADKRGISVYEVCNELVASVLGKPTSVFYLPYILGTMQNPHAMAGFYGVRSQTSKADLLRAVYQGVTFNHMEGMQLFLKGGMTPKRVFLAGGGSKSAVWSQMFADVFDLPVSIASNSELGAYGAAMCAGIGAGVWADYADAAQSVAVKHHYEPDPKAAATARLRFAEYQQLCLDMQDTWERLFKLGE